MYVREINIVYIYICVLWKHNDLQSVAITYFLFEILSLQLQWSPCKAGNKRTATSSQYLKCIDDGVVFFSMKTNARYAQIKLTVHETWGLIQFAVHPYWIYIHTFHYILSDISSCVFTSLSGRSTFNWIDECAYTHSSMHDAWRLIKSSSSTLVLQIDNKVKFTWSSLNKSHANWMVNLIVCSSHRLSLLEAVDFDYL